MRRPTKRGEHLTAEKSESKEPKEKRYKEGGVGVGRRRVEERKKRGNRPTNIDFPFRYMMEYMYIYINMHG